MKISTKKAIIVGVLVIGIAAPASAIVMPVMEVGPFAHFAWMAQLAQQVTTSTNMVKSVFNQVQQLTNESRNLASIGPVVRGAIGNEIGSITSGSSQAPGDAAAGQIIQQSAGAANTVAQADQRAQSADGAKSQAQVSNLYLSSIADEAVKGNALAAEEHQQQKNDTAAKTEVLQNLFGGGTPSGEQF